MLARVSAAVIIGIEAVPVVVEVDVSPGLPGLTMVGLPDATVRESRDRVRAAIKNSGFPFPDERITVSLAPADVRKVGAAFDLPIAVGILAASGVLPDRSEAPMTVVGGLSLDGGVPPIRGVLPIAIAARRAERTLVFPAANAAEAQVVAGLRAHAVRSLLDAARLVVSPESAPLVEGRSAPAATSDASPNFDLADVRGQFIARRAVEIAAAGGHHLLLSGPPGAGKTMIARRLPSVLPPLEFDEALTVTTIHSVAGLLAPGSGLLSSRPFRAPHHTASDVALVGGGSIPRPGELSLAHGGVLFLDELPEFSRRVLETLRQPLEEGVVHIARAARAAVFPADVMLVAAMNPCPCGHAGSGQTPCRCPSGAVERYRRKLSGPLLERFDLSIQVPAVTFEDFSVEAPAESSATVRARVVAARTRQRERQGCVNGRLDGRAREVHCQLGQEGARALLSQAAVRFHWSARTTARVLRVARTIADLAGRSTIAESDLAEALHFRQWSQGG